MRYVICYDISDDRRRSRVATALLDYGQRIQESVFTAQLDADLVARMASRLEKVVDPIDDCIHVFALCEKCQEKVRQLGNARLPEERDFYVL